MRKFFSDNKLLNQVTVITVSMFCKSCFGNIHLHVKLSTNISGFLVQEKKEEEEKGQFTTWIRSVNILSSHS